MYSSENGFKNRKGIKYIWWKTRSPIYFVLQPEHTNEDREAYTAQQGMKGWNIFNEQVQSMYAIPSVPIDS